MEQITARIRKSLSDAIDEKTRNSFHRYFREEVKCHGVKTAEVTKIGRTYFDGIKHLGKKEIFSLCEELFASDYCEEAFIAADWAYRMQRKYEPSDFTVFERWVEKYVNNWAKCDTLCNHAIGTLVEMYPEHILDLKRWARSSSRWVKRASAVTLILPARRGLFLEDVFGISDILLKDTDDMVQKGYGWLLKEASKAHQKEVFEYVMEKKNVMPRTALRYAIEKMPDDMRKRAMAK